MRSRPRNSAHRRLFSEILKPRLWSSAAEECGCWPEFIGVVGLCGVGNGCRQYTVSSGAAAPAYAADGRSSRAIRAVCPEKVEGGSVAGLDSLEILAPGTTCDGAGYRVRTGDIKLGETKRAVPGRNRQRQVVDITRRSVTWTSSPLRPQGGKSGGKRVTNRSNSKKRVGVSHEVNRLSQTAHIPAIRNTNAYAGWVVAP